jgi:3-isopropylmalate/(R)-2-methylmalate dehydratase large subunit
MAIPANAIRSQRRSSTWDLEAGKPLLGHPIDVVFIGSCTNSRISDLRAAAGVLKGRKVNPNVASWWFPARMEVKQQAIAEGLDRDLPRRRVRLREAGCSMCIAMNGDQLSRANTASRPATAISKAGRARADARSSPRR